MSQAAKMNESIEQAFQALQTALVSLEKAVSERAENITSQPASADTQMAQASHALSEEDKQAVQDELFRLKSLVSEASGLILSSQNGSGES